MAIARTRKITIAILAGVVNFLPHPNPPRTRGPGVRNNPPREFDPGVRNSQMI